jgi:hypothetical protein
MKFNNYLNESFEDKVFVLIDNFMQEKSITSGVDLLNSDTWKELLNYFTKETGIRISVGKSPVNNIRGESNIEGIRILVPDGPVTNKTRGNALGTLFHEYNHQMQDKDKPILSYDYVSISKNNHSLMEFCNYFLQKTERKSQSVSIAIASILSGYDVPALIGEIKEKTPKTKNFDEASYVFQTALASMKNLEEAQLAIFKSLFIVCGFVYSLHLQTGNPGEDMDFVRKAKREIKNKWIRFEHNFNDTYKKFHAYFKRYGII